MSLLEDVIAGEIWRHLKDDNHEIRITVRSTANAVEVEATRGSVTRRLFDNDPCRNDTIVSTWCRRTAERIRRMVHS